MQEIILFIVAIIGGTVGSIAGSGSTICFAVLIFLNIPLDIAIASNKMGVLGITLLSTRNFYKAKRIEKSFALQLTLIAIIAAAIGATIIVNIDKEFLYPFVSIILIFIFFFILFKKKMGIEKKKESWIWRPAYFLARIYSGMIGVSGHTLSIFSLTSFAGKDFLTASGNSIIAGMFGILMSIAVFLYAGLIDWSLSLPLFFGYLIGGHIGSHLAIKKGNDFIRKMILIVLAITIVQLVIKSFS